ncbi:carboxylesterase/lipase family protein [Pseudonocardia benzenivorans]|uniref:Carboxylic ester hydrolase n=2 Tax=Pseudonocardia TaxID=1847 RepID=F4D1Y4_PSEUX|nr:carboxylesterase family protein [Pseudonocardia dioxanivorans]AEA28044.1 Carboxylesterase [Pseudonocardia dioxanivorans CB1190]GJF06255.1 carboxylic ester hydrolase [Pseudonocardia sp. D17]
MTEHPRVTIRSGAVEGRWRDGVAAFLGIPYAAPPFGANRMAPPRPVEAWDGTRDAGRMGPTVPKGDYPPQYQPLFPEVVVPGEDCLNVNVWTPDPGAAGLPVLVWIHGGSFMNGSNSVAEYDGTAFARDGVVCVAVNYRLAAEGFLFLDDSAEAGVANLGLQDQVAALEWVRDNISAFGGDPDRVTVAGESAGAMSVTTLTAMPSARGLFGRAITQSGAWAHTLTPELGRTVGRLLAEALGVPATREAIAAVPLPRLVQVASDLVVEVQTAPDPQKWGSIAMSLLPFAPVVDGTLLPEHPLEAARAGRTAPVDLLTGWNRDEARLFLVAAGTIDLVDEPTLLGGAAAYGLGPDGVAAYREARPGASPGDLMAALVTDWFFGVPALRYAEARVTAGTGTSWVYRFDHPEPGVNGGLGACHGVEIPFVFGTADHESTRTRIGPPSAAVTEAAHGAWTAFVTRGNPGWDAYDLDRRITGLIAEKAQGVPDPNRSDRLLWEGVR